MSKNILITGGAGFIGSHLAHRLLSEGTFNIAIIDDLNDFYSPELKKRNLESISEIGPIAFFEADIRSFEALSEIFNRFRPDTVVHLAARAGVRPSLADPFLYTETNVNGTLNLLELSRRTQVEQFIFGSSSSVYGINGKIPFSEDDRIYQTISPYAATKAAGEHLCHTFSHLYGIRTICLRFFTVYGPRQRPDLAICKFSRLIAEEKPIPVFGDGSTRRDYTYIDDIIQGIRAAIDYRNSMFEIFNVGESQTVELNRLIALLEENLGKKALIDRKPMQPGDVPVTFADISKARNLLGYNPQTKIEDGIPKFVEWFNANRLIVAATK